MTSNVYKFNFFPNCYRVNRAKLFHHLAIKKFTVYKDVPLRDMPTLCNDSEKIVNFIAKHIKQLSKRFIFEQNKLTLVLLASDENFSLKPPLM